MASPAFHDNFASAPRTKEENQERAFIAASRRKDRSLNARFESACRASIVHKNRTGKAFRITKEIVEKEAMYEEIDEKVRVKRNSILRTERTEVDKQFDNYLVAMLAACGKNQSFNTTPGSRSSLSPGTDYNDGTLIDTTIWHTATPNRMESGSPWVVTTINESAAVFSPPLLDETVKTSSQMTWLTQMSSPIYAQLSEDYSQHTGKQMVGNSVTLDLKERCGPTTPQDRFFFSEFNGFNELFMDQETPFSRTTKDLVEMDKFITWDGL